MKKLVVVLALLTLLPGIASAGPIVVGSVGGGAIAGAILDNLDWLTLGAGSKTNVVTGMTVNLVTDAGAVTGASSGLYAAPWISGSNGAGFGNLTGADTTTYATSGKNGSPNVGAMVEFVLPGLYNNFGLLWGSIDTYNTLSFYADNTLLFEVLGNNAVLAPANGNQGESGTMYVNISNDVAFNRVVATSSNYAFEIDNVSYGVPEPATVSLFGVGLIGLAAAARRRIKK